MSNEEKFKDSLKGLLDEQQFPYDTATWDKASQFLDEDSRRKKRFLFFLFLGLGLGLLLIGYLSFPLKNAGNTYAQADKTNTVPAEPAVKPVPAPVKKEATTQARTPQAKTISSTAALREPASEPAPVPDRNVKSASAPVHSPSHSPLTSTKTRKTNSMNGTTVIAASPATPISVIATIKNTATKNTRSKKEKEEKQMDLPLVQTSDTKEVNTKQDAKNDIVTNDPPSAAPVSSADGNDQTEKKTGNEPTPLAAETAKQEAAVADTLVPSVKDSLLKKSPLVLVPDSILPAVAQATLPNTPDPNYCYVEAGTYFNFGWKYKQVREGTGFNPYIGVSYLNKITEKIALSFGAYYTSVAHLKLDNKIIKESRIVFGEENDVTSITPVTINYVAVPVKLHYTKDAKQVFTFGYSFGYLLDVQSKVETYTERLNTQENKKSYRTGGYVEGFKTFNSQLSLGYRRFLYTNLWLNGEVFFGLTDLRDDTFFEIHKFERASGLKISLTYNLLKK